MSSVGGPVSADQYLRGLLAREAVDTGPKSPLRGLASEVETIAREIAGGQVLGVHPAGGFERGTANASGVSLDLLVSLAPTLSEPVGSVYEALYEQLDRRGLQLIRRDISIAALMGGIGVDVIPGRREALTTDVHEFWLDRPGRAVKTNLTQHVINAASAGRREEVRVMKLWRDQQELDFPSFYLELTVTAALRKHPLGDLAANVWAVLGYLESLFPARSVLDPVNANNIVSDLLDSAGRDAIRKAAAAARAARAWTEIVS